MADYQFIPIYFQYPKQNDSERQLAKAPTQFRLACSLPCLSRRQTGNRLSSSREGGSTSPATDKNCPQGSFLLRQRVNHTAVSSRTSHLMVKHGSQKDNCQPRAAGPSMGPRVRKRESTVDQAAHRQLGDSGLASNCATYQPLTTTLD